MPLATLRPAVELELLPGDVLVAALGRHLRIRATRAASSSARRACERIVAAHHGSRWRSCRPLLLEAVAAFADGAPQEDDMTVVLVKRERRS